MTPSEPKPTPQQPALKFEGLPDGVEAYKVGIPSENEFELAGLSIYKGGRVPGTAAGVIVRPSKGYTFQPLQVADIRTLTIKDGPERMYMVVKQQETTPCKVTINFSITNSFDQAMLDAALAAISRIPGFVDLKVE